MDDILNNLDPKKKEKIVKKSSLKVSTWENKHIEPVANLDNIPFHDHHVIWDSKSIEEQELEKINNPRKKIDEPKTPYLPYDGEDDEYLQKLNEINKVQPTKELFEDVCKKLVGKNDKENEEEQKKHEFNDKRNKSYKNEFAMAKKLKQEEQDEDEEEENRANLMNETLKNTLYNKMYKNFDNN